jgi:hypothetical protein
LFGFIKRKINGKNKFILNFFVSMAYTAFEGYHITNNCCTTDNNKAYPKNQGILRIKKQSIPITE